MAANLLLLALFCLFIARGSAHENSSNHVVKKRIHYIEQDERQFDHVHFSRTGRWIGQPMGLLHDNNGIIHVVYETAVFPKLADECYKAVFGCSYDLEMKRFKWGRASTTDRGLTWKVHSGFLDAEKLRLPEHKFLTAGGIVRHPKGDPTRYYVIAYGVRSTGRTLKPRIHTIFADYDFEIDVEKEGYEAECVTPDVEKKGYEAEGVTPDAEEKGYEAEGVTPSLFVYNATVYIAYSKSASQCSVYIAEAEKEIGAESVLHLPLERGGLSPQILLLDSKKFALVVTKAAESDKMFTCYTIGELVTDGTKLKFALVQENAFMPLDVGYGENFVFTKVNDDVIAVGSRDPSSFKRMDVKALIDKPTLYELLGYSGLTLLRKITFEGDRLKQDSWIIENDFGSESWTRNLPKSSLAKVKSLTKAVTEGAVSLTINFKGADGDQQSNGSFIMAFYQTSAKRNTTHAVGIKKETSTSKHSNQQKYTLFLGEQEGRKVVNLAELRPAAEVWGDNVPDQTKIILDRSVMEIYGADGAVVYTGPYLITEQALLDCFVLSLEKGIVISVSTVVLHGTSATEMTATTTAKALRGHRPPRSGAFASMMCATRQAVQRSYQC